MEHTNFDDLNINEDILKGVYLYGFKAPSKIQINGIQSINTGKDCLLQSQSGTGKTATYLLGIFNRMNYDDTCQTIIITPTRELATQVFKVANYIAKYSKFKLALCIGGTNINTNMFELKKTNLIIGTLGRINHMIQTKKIKMNNLKMLVIDEADNLLSDGVTENLQNMFNKIPKGIQYLLISATLSQNVFNLSNNLMDNPIKVLLRKNEIPVDLISQFYIDVEVEDYKFDVLLDLYNLISTTQAIIFCNTIRKVTWLTDNLKEKNFSITAIHGKMTQQERTDIVNEFRDGKTRLLLTTDLLARGIDIPQVNLVINYDLPISKETYIHRIGRCGRFGKKGVSITMVKMEDSMDIKLLNKMKNYYKLNISEIPENINDYI
jgi:superfamily II DNA/RNA helicase